MLAGADPDYCLLLPNSYANATTNLENLRNQHRDISKDESSLLLLHVIKRELRVVHGVGRGVDVVVRVLERALDTGD